MHTCKATTDLKAAIRTAQTRGHMYADYKG